MESSLTMASFPSFLLRSTRSFPNSYLPIFKTSSSRGAISLTIRAASAASSSDSNSNSSAHKSNSIVSTLKSTTAAVVLAAAVFGSFHKVVPPARAESPPTMTEELEENAEEVVEKNPNLGNSEVVEKNPNLGNQESSPLTEFLESNTEAIEALKSLLKQKLDEHDNNESLKILKKLSTAQPENMEWKFLTARLLCEMDNVKEAKQAFEEILSRNPLSFEALFENAVLMVLCGEGEAGLKRLEDALKVAEEENKAKEARDIRFIMAQAQGMQKHVGEAFIRCEELEKQDPNDFRPYFCRGVIYSVIEMHEKAENQFAKYRELSPNKFEVEGYLRTPSSRMKELRADEN